MKNYKFLLTCLFIAVLSGCAVPGPKYAEYSKNISTLATDKGRIYFFRDDSFAGGGVRPDIKLNDAVIGESLPGAFFLVDKDPGNYKVSTATEVDRSLEFVLAAGETKYVRTYVSMGFLVGHIIPELVNEDDAMKKIPQLTYAGFYDPNNPKPKSSNSNDQ